eukprot:5143542-Pleurochrysis_carterae.AAC.1
MLASVNVRHAHVVDVVANEIAGCACRRHSLHAKLRAMLLQASDASLVHCGSSFSTSARL